MQYVSARFMQRAVAAFYDGIIITVFIFVFGFFMSAIELDSSYVGLLVFLLIVLNYEPLLVSRYGGTIGHRGADIMVIRETRDGHARVSYPRALARFLIKVSLGSFSLLFMLMQGRQALHDIVTATAVVKVRDGRPHAVATKPGK